MSSSSTQGQYNHHVFNTFSNSEFNPKPIIKHEKPIPKSIKYSQHFKRNINNEGQHSSLMTNRTTYQGTAHSINDGSLTSRRLITHDNPLPSSDRLLLKLPNNQEKDKQNLQNLLKLKEKEAKYLKAKALLNNQHEREKEAINKRNEMRRIRLKVHNILDKGQLNICPDFEAKNSSYNFQQLDFATGAYNKKRELHYQTKFHFDKNSYGEAHERMNMMIDLDDLKRYQKKTDDLLNENLTTEEKNYIKNDPAYFFNRNNTTTETNTEVFKVKSLVSKLNEEDLLNEPKKLQTDRAKPLYHLATSTDELTKFLYEPIAIKKKVKIKAIGPSELQKQKEASIKEQKSYANKTFTTQLYSSKQFIPPYEYVSKEVEKMDKLISLSKRPWIMTKRSIEDIRRTENKKAYNPKEGKKLLEKIDTNAYNSVSLEKKDVITLQDQLSQIKSTYKRRPGQRSSIIFISNDNDTKNNDTL